MVIFNPLFKAIARPDLTSEHWVAVLVEANHQCRFTVIAAYFKFRIPTAVHVNNLYQTLSNVRGAVIVCLDVNAFSTVWHSQGTDRRGHLIEGMIQKNNLVCKNQISTHHTFNGVRGRTNIDVTLTSLEMEDWLSNWKIVPDCTSSDHNLIFFDVQSGTLDTSDPEMSGFQMKELTGNNSRQHVYIYFLNSKIPLYKARSMREPIFSTVSPIRQRLYQSRGKV